MKSFRLLLCFATCQAGLALPPAVAQTAAASAAPLSTAAATIRGTVRNAATATNLNQASVRVTGRPQEYLTERDGSYAITGLGSGTYEITVSFVGLDPQTKAVTVGAGETAQHDFELTSSLYKMDAFIVAGELEGNAAELNKQKKSDVFINAVSADMLGTVPGGNVGEFLKYVPGLLIDYGAFPEAESVSMRGQDADATQFTFDGMPQASSGRVPRAADESTTGMNFNDMTIDNIEAIEVYKAPPAWMAPSTGGVINAVRKNAFAQKGRRLTIVGTLNGNSQWLTFSPMRGPGGEKTIPIQPGLRLNYSEAFLNNTLGIAFTYGQTGKLDPRHNYIQAFARLDGKTGAALAADPTTAATPLRYGTFSLVNTTNEKHTRNIAFDLDYRLGARTVLKLNASHTSQITRAFNSRMNLPAGAIDPGATAEDTTSRNVAPNLVGDNNTLENQNFGYTGRIEHRAGAWRFDAAAQYSKSDAENRMLPDHVQTSRFVYTGASTVRFRTPANEAVSHVEQLAGPDIFDPANYRFASGAATTTTGRIGIMPRAQYDRQWYLTANARRDLAALRFPLELRAGVSYTRLEREKWLKNSNLDYVGPDGRYRSGDETLTLAGLAWTDGPRAPYFQNPPRYDIYKLADFLNANPGQFLDIDGLNTRNTLQGSQTFGQDITAGYVSATMRAGPRLTLIGGLRHEITEFEARGPLLDLALAAGINPRNNPPANNLLDSHEYWRAALSKTQRATSSYRDYFPNWQAAWRFTPDLILRTAVTRAMKRPKLHSILPNTNVSFNQTTGEGRVSVNNTALQPSYSNNIDISLELFTRPSGSLSVGWFQKKISGYVISDESIVGDGPDNGFGGEYAGYELLTQENGGTGRFAGFEAAGRQQLARYLKFLPEPARNFGVFFSYTKNTKGETTDLAGRPVRPTAPNFFDWFASYGVSYETPRRQFYLEARATVFPESLSTRPTANDLRGTSISATEKWDLTARYRFSRRYSLEFNARNIFAEKGREFRSGGRVTRWDFYDTFYALSFTANFGDR
ncbi:MAG: TonB-dependent receptor [Opitutaceae bacterium]|nr:TonB-dependent receptor [Opitutaceae bacterium]